MYPKTVISFLNSLDFKVSFINSETAPGYDGEKFSFNVKWHYYLIDRINSVSWGRGGYEYFEKDGNYIFTIVQWFPRLCVYSDFEGWQNKQFTGRGEFALNFGNYKVKITVPADHLWAGARARTCARAHEHWACIRAREGRVRMLVRMPMRVRA